jgi:hypothetical protein
MVGMQRKNTQGQLYLNDKDVGSVHIRGWRSSWGFGDFHPNEGFAEFATIFGNWSLLMHADDDQTQLSPEASEELRRAEYAMDALRAKLFMPETKEWRAIQQVNIDGHLIEWKEG